MIGSALTKHLVEKGFQVTILSRSAAGSKTAGVNYARWDVEKGTIDASAIAKADYLVHLAGANVAEGRWTAERKRAIVDSRVQSGALLVKAIRDTPNKIKAVISASAIGWYGADPQIPNPNPYVETDMPAPDFLGSTCAAWEQSLQPLVAMGKRVVWLRTGIVLSNSGGAYAEFKKPLRFGLATALGSGSQIVSWIHIEDMAWLYTQALQNEGWSGIYNAVAPAPVSNEALVKTIAAQQGGFHVNVHVPAAALKLALGEMSTEVLKSCTVSAGKLLSAGYNFIFPNLGTAVFNLEKKAT